MEDLTLEDGLLENLDVNFEDDTQLDVVVEYTFRKPKRQLDDESREQALADESAAAARRLDGHPSIQLVDDLQNLSNVISTTTGTVTDPVAIPTQDTSIHDNVTSQDEPMRETQPDPQTNDAIPSSDVNGEQIKADNGMDDELTAPSPIVNQPEQSTSRRRHTRRKPDSSRLNESSPPETKKSRLNEDDYWVDTFLAERTESYVQRQKN